ncbi:hypothetical protein T265_09147 [Opisthorchis viverrini]|uniref:Uncharacterized protein n=1 Tax=Opisthorchis viverrini TaxID=6198 RepID=A0A074ZHT7_OPIVI|nr:hypothetical protein T265_09147 [Opisthorchis viverrini]KER22840.1 hypothetical protein T265_09147 [Opisthorchis viverrini]
MDSSRLENAPQENNKGCRLYCCMSSASKTHHNELEVLTDMKVHKTKALFKSIIIIDSMTSVFNADASPPYNHDLFESLIVKKTITCLQPGTVRITRSPPWKASSTDSTQAFRDLLHNPLPSQGLATSLFTPLRIGHGKQHSLRQTMHTSMPSESSVSARAACCPACFRVRKLNAARQTGCQGLRTDLEIPEDVRTM